MDRVIKEAKEVGLKEEEKEMVLRHASVKGANRKEVVAAKTTPKEKERAVEATKGRATIGNRLDPVDQFPVARKRRHVHMERGVLRCVITVIALNGMNHGKSRRLRKGAGT